MRRSLLVSLSLFATLQTPALSQQVIVRSGDTLSGIADQYNISVRSLMEQNKIFNADSLQIGQKLELPEKAELGVSFSHKYHTVEAGENISKIASYYNLDKESILALNNLNNPNLLYLGQKITLPSEVQVTKRIQNESSPNYHIIRKGESLSVISKRYGIPINNLISLNNMHSPSVVMPGEKIFLKKSLGNKDSKYKNKTNQNSIARINKSLDVTLTTEGNADWRKYGSLKINWTNWKTMNGSHVAPAINNGGKPLFLAINCKTTRMNTTGKNNQWKKWFAPSNEFEFNLLDDLCNPKAKNN